ncbi:MAG: 6-carboxytetrahydropterin synthase [Phycisphaerales bacterium]|nr:6-carboxytetrahydropterin synthase [Phycisphaerales bacterium]
MFELEVRRTFSAAHSVKIRGEQEPLHGHDWQVDVVVRAADLDSEGMACDFHELERALDSVLRPFASRNLNETPPFDARNPTAEAVAQYIAQEMNLCLPARVAIQSVRVTEAPGCAARYVPSPHTQRS